MMNLRDNYLIQKHFLRKRIGIIRRRVLIRKFGYLFFRKTICNVLPSTAQSHYLKNIKKTAFLKLKMSWYNERTEWKYNLRAKLHYNFVLEKRCFKKLALYYVKKKTKRVKATIAQVMFEKNFVKQILKLFFNKWKKYVNYNKDQHLKNAIADHHFEFRWKFVRLRHYFYKWRIFTMNNEIIKTRIEEVSKLYRNKLLKRVFNAFSLYVQCRRFRNKQMERASQLYSRKLKEKSINKLMSFKTYMLFQKDRNEFLNSFHERKLLKQCMVVLLRNVERNKYVRERLNIFEEQKSVRMKETALNTWRNYILNEKQNGQKQRLAENLCDFHSKKICFKQLKMYGIYKKEKRNYQIITGAKIALILEKKVLSDFFDAWRNFKNVRINKKKLLEFALSHFELKLKRKHFHTWLNFKDYKKNKRHELMELDKHFNNRLLRNSFDKLKRFVKDKRLYNIKLLEAKKYYRHNLIRENFRIIIKTAARIKDEQLTHYLENEKRRMMLAQKYLRLWKIKSKHSKLRKPPVMMVGRNIKVNLVDLDTVSIREKLTLKSVQRDHSLLYFPDVFQWDPMCFAKPKVPDYMKNCFKNC